jgi:hypothetical protein
VALEGAGFELPHIETFFRRFFQPEAGADNGLALAGLIYDPESLGVPKIRTLFEAT